MAAFGLTAAALAGCSAQPGSDTPHSGGGEANLVLPSALRDGGVSFLGIPGQVYLYAGLVICLLGLAFGLLTYGKLKNLPVHESMREISELIYTTCKAYLVKQGRFLLGLWVFIAIVIVVYYAVLVKLAWWQILVIILFSLIGMAGSFGVAWFGIRINTFANSRTAYASLRGEKWPVHEIPTRSGMSVGMVLISLELFLMLVILAFLPLDLAGKCFIGFAIGESLGAATLRIAGGIFTKIADIGSDLMKIVFKIGEDDPRNPGTIADCTGDNAGDSVGPSADGFETYGVTGVALITFLLLGIGLSGGENPALQATLLIWIFAVRSLMLIASLVSYWINEAIAKSRYGATDFDFERPLSSLVWVTSLVSIALTFLASAVFLAENAGNGVHDPTLWWKLSIIVSCGTLAGALIPELVKVFTSTKSSHVKEVVKSSKEGGPSLNILSGFVAGNFSAYWLGIAIVGLMGIAYLVSTTGVGDALNTLPEAAAVFAFGLVAFGFLGMGPVTIAVDSYGPVTDNAQSVYELSRIEAVPDIDAKIRSAEGYEPKWNAAKAMLEENDGAGNTFKATAKPVLIGTAVVGATTMIFSIVMTLTNGLQSDLVKNLSLIHPPFLLGLITGGAMIYWFTGASTQAVTTGAYRAVEFIKSHIHLDDSADAKASTKDSTEVVEICTKYAQQGMLMIFLAIFFGTLAFAFVDPYFFIGYLISIAIVGLFQAIFMANAGGAWDNAKKVVETELAAKGTDLHDATIVGDTVGDPFKDTSSVALNPVIKFTTLFGLLAVELAVSISSQGNQAVTSVLAAVFFALSMYFVWRSFFRMRIEDVEDPPAGGEPSDTPERDAAATVQAADPATQPAAEPAQR
ncbi:sodium-translocating pyrophosphatase [Propionicicella superfundia]|uniref:sodium-translocating pyrophosphatase n=1 Tax=Propionicicella superfundia TaxID=348582 RepID=UPI0012EBF579|nr:sodium-translocating pyrophosphatase [Propionicicella superfundia]